MSNGVVFSISLIIGLISIIYGWLHNFTLYGLVTRTFIAFAGSFVMLKISFHMLKIVLKGKKAKPKQAFKPLQVRKIKRNADSVTETIEKVKGEDEG